MARRNLGNGGSATRRKRLVRLAFTCGASNCVIWIDDQAEILVRRRFAALGLTPTGIKQILQDWMLAGRPFDERRETRSEYAANREFWYRAIIPVDGLPRGLFVEMELSDPDPEYPTVTILNAHEQP